MIEFIAILLAAIFGAVKAPVWTVAAATLLLAAPSLARDRSMVFRTGEGRQAMLMLGAASLFYAFMFSWAAYGIGLIVVRLTLGF